MTPTDTQKSAALHLVNPKTPANVGGVLRAASIFGAEQLTWTGNRVNDALHRYTGTAFGSKKMRLPREERMKAYDIDWGQDDDGLQKAIDAGFIPVCVEIVEGAIPLPYFEHPDRAVYVLGPEDGHVPKGIRHATHWFIQIPTTARPDRDTLCLNLAATVNVVLYDRYVKEQFA